MPELYHNPLSAYEKLGNRAGNGNSHEPLPPRFDAMREQTLRRVKIDLEYGRIDAAIEAVRAFGRAVHPPAPERLSEQERLALPLASVLSVRIANRLEREGMLTVGDVLGVSRASLLAIRGMGEGGVSEIFRVTGRE